MLHAAAPRPKTSASGLQVQIVRIERRADEHGGALALAEHLDDEPRADGGEPWVHVTDRKALAEDVSEAAGGRATGEAAPPPRPGAPPRLRRRRARPRPPRPPAPSSGGLWPGGSASVTLCTSSVTTAFGTPVASCRSS